MTNRKPIVAANWKMNAAPEGWDNKDSPFRPREDINVLVFPSLLDIHVCIEKSLLTGAQAARPEDSGAFTGDVSMRLLADHGCTYVLCGHSERRTHHSESDSFVGAQVKAAVSAGLIPIVCIGETLDQREMGQAEDIVKAQLEALEEIPSIIAYEPVWAIGTGKTASPEDAESMHAFIRSLLPDGRKEDTRIIYGGSVKPESAAALYAQENIDGFLVGGASLVPASFSAIVDCCKIKG